MLLLLKTYFKAIGQSFYNVPLYQAVLRGQTKPWSGYGFVYALVLAALLSLVSFVQVGIILKKIEQDVLPKFAAQMPEITINKGEVSVDVPQPHTIILDKKPVLVIDTKAKVADAQTSKVPIFITKDTVYLVKSNGAREAKFIDKTITTKFNAQMLQSFIAKLLSWGLLLTWPLMVLGSWLVLLIQGVCVALASYMITAFMPEEFEFGHRLRIALVAITPPLLLQLLITCLGYVGLTFQLNNLTVMGVALVYFYTILRAGRLTNIMQ